MKAFAYESFRRYYRQLPATIQKKVDKQIHLLSQNLRYPSLHVKKIQGTRNVWEARVDLQYRLSFEILGGALYLRAVGNHDEVLKNP